MPYFAWLQLASVTSDEKSFLTNINQLNSIVLDRLQRGGDVVQLLVLVAGVRAPALKPAALQRFDQGAQDCSIAKVFH